MAAITIAAFWHGILGLDGDGAVRTPLYGWADGRAVSVLEPLGARIDPHEFRALTGCFLTATYPAVRIAWLRQSRPDLFAAVRCWSSFADYAVQRLTGSQRTSVSMASATGLLSLDGQGWSRSVLDAVGVDPARLPRVVDVEDGTGLQREWAARWPSLAGAVWFPPLGDGACANVGTGAVGERRPCVTVGTSAAVRVLRPLQPGDDTHDLWRYRLDATTEVVGGALSNGGIGMAFLDRLFSRIDRTALSGTLQGGALGGDGLQVLPSLLAERSDDWGPDSGAAILGLRPHTTPLAIARAWSEALAQRVSVLVARLEKSFGSADEIRATGGMFRSVPGWLWTVADASGRPLALAADTEATSRGAAIVAARHLGWIANLLDVEVEISMRAEPRAAFRAVHEAAIIRQQRLVHALSPDLRNPEAPGPVREHHQRTE